MRLLRSIEVGLACVAIAMLIMSTPAFVAMVKYRAMLFPSGGDYSISVHWHVWRMLGVAVLVFVVSFFWRYRWTR